MRKIEKLKVIKFKTSDRTRKGYGVLFRAKLEDGEWIQIPWVWTKGDCKKSERNPMLWAGLVENGINATMDLIQMLDNEGPYKSKKNKAAVEAMERHYSERELFTPRGVVK